MALTNDYDCVVREVGAAVGCLNAARVAAVQWRSIVRQLVAERLGDHSVSEYVLNDPACRAVVELSVRLEHATDLLEALDHDIVRLRAPGNGLSSQTAPSRKARGRRTKRGAVEFTDREERVLAGIMVGWRAKTIAAAEGISESMVRAAIRSLVRKLGVNSQLAAAAKARELGLAG